MPDTDARCIAGRQRGRSVGDPDASRDRLGVPASSVRPRRFLVTRVMPAVCLLVILATLVVAPASEQRTIVLGTLVAMAAGLASTAIGVYGGVLVPGLLLMGVDPRFAAAASLFLQVLVIPIGAGAHYRLGNVTRSIALPLILGGVVGAFLGPFFASMLPKDVIARLVSAAHRGRGRRGPGHAPLGWPGHHPAAG